MNVSRSTTRRPGRPPQFDGDQVVASAMDLFWRQGYDDTSVAQLESELAVNRSTLYASFDGKAGLYEAAVGAYVDAMGRRLVEPLRTGSAGLDDLLVFVERLRQILMDPDTPPGCLIVNTMGTGRPPAAADGYLADIRASFEAVLTRAAARDEIAEDEVEDKAATVLAAVIGLNVMAKSIGDVEALGALFQGLAATIDDWRRAS